VVSPWGGYPVEFKLKLMHELERGTSVADAARAFGVGGKTAYNWLREYELGGAKALEPKMPGRPGRPPADDARRRAVTAMRREHPEYGTRRIQGLLRRFEGLGVSESTVRRILHEEGLLDDRPPELPKPRPPETRFERAEPNQLWQSDIFTFLLRRHTRVYVTAFLDDNSRFVVSHVLAHHQRATLVVEALERGIATYGTPQEVLTDQGRQYTAWRGETAFEALLRQYGIRHVKSRPHHPMTLGKVERFWKTLWDEFLSRTVFGDFADCERRLSLFVQAYNFQRPHQEIGGLVPADRYFRAAPQVRAAVEASVQANALRLAIQKPVQKPFYLVGRLGDRDVYIAAAGSGVQVQLGDEAPHAISFAEEDGHVDEVPTRVQAFAREDAETSAPPEPSHASVAQEGGGSGRGGAAPGAAGAVGALGGDAGDGRRPDGRNQPASLLPAGNTGSGGDAAGADARGGGRGRRGSWGEPGGGARVPPQADGAAEAAGRAPLAPHPEAGEAGHLDDRAWPATQGEDGPCLDASWDEVFDGLEATPDVPGDAPADTGFTSDDDLRGRAVSWARNSPATGRPGTLRPPCPEAWMTDEPKKPTYTPLPEVPEEIRERYQVLLEVLAGKETVSGGARRLRLSRNHFQSLLHRGLEGLLEGLSPQPPGRPAKPKRQAEPSWQRR
jgi:transposase InsO family protein